MMNLYKIIAKDTIDLIVVSTRSGAFDVWLDRYRDKEGKFPKIESLVWIADITKGDVVVSLKKSKIVG